MVKTDRPNFGALNAKVVLVEKVIDPASNSFRVRMTLPNPNKKIPAGLRCRVDFMVAQQAPARDAVPVAPAMPAPEPATSSVGQKPGAAPVSKRLPDPLELSAVKKSMTDAGRALPGARLINQDRPVEARSAVKSYLQMRQSRLSISTSLAASGKTDVPAMSSFVVPRMTAMR